VPAASEHGPHFQIGRVADLTRRRFARSPSGMTAAHPMRLWGLLAIVTLWKSSAT
jgi:hypothetical protein